jgi:hypothetical protein
MPMNRGDGPALARPTVARRRRGLVTALLTALLFGVFALGVARGEVVLHGGQGIGRTMRIVDIWRELLDNLPPQAPGWLGREVLLALLVLGGVAMAYVLVATLRLPDRDE